MWFFLALYFALATSIGFFLIKFMSKQISALGLLLLMNIVTAPFMILYFFYQGIPEVTGYFYIFILLAALLDIAAAITSFWAIEMSSISLLSPISSFNPIFTTLIAAITIHETPPPLKLLGIGVIVLGAYFLHLNDMKHGFLAPFQKLFSDKGVQLFLLANLLWGITPVLQKQAIFQTTPQHPLYTSFAELLVISAFITPFTWKERKRITQVVKRYHIGILIIGMGATVSAWAAFTALAEAPVGYVTAIFKLSTLFSIILGALFLKEERIYERLLGAGVMVAGTLLLAF